ncbi:MAG: hypothetical protein QXD04_05650, partial [Candidatus Bathyarchaeia archaeon]
FGMGYTLYIMITTLGRVLYTPLMGGRWTLIIPTILGFLLYTAISERYRFLSRWGAAAITGSGLGFAVSRAIPVQILGQVKMFYIKLDGSDAFGIINWIIISITAITTIMYFTFTREHKGILGTVSKIGRWSMMIAFGATFGSTIGGDLTYVIERSIFLSRYPQVYLLIPAAAVILYDAYRRRKS